jgi:iron-sulfur cluster assembly protein
MLTITPSAATAIKTILDSANVPEDGGIRIAVAQQNGAQARLELSLTEAPLAGDEVLEEDGANVFLDEMAAIALDDKALDAEIEGDEINFGILERDGPEDADEPPPESA